MTRFVCGLGEWGRTWVDRTKVYRPTAATVMLAVASTLVIALGGCASQTGIAPSSAKLVAPTTLGADAATASPAIAADWWHAFGDPALDALVQRALDGNPSLRVAQARIERAAANAGIASAADGFQLTGSADASRQRFTATGLYPPPLAGGIYSTGTVQLNGSWEFDFFGRNRAALDAAIGAQRASEADAQAARVMLAANVVRSYVQLARLVEQRSVIGRSLDQRQQILSLIQQRVGAGLDTTVELRLGEGSLPETRQQIEVIDEQIMLSRHALAALTAQPPNALDRVSPALQTVHAVPLPADVPADLLGRRADIAAARWRIEAADRDVASARAQFFPNVNLAAFVGLSSIGLDRLVGSKSEIYGIGPAIRLPIFDSGRIRANLRGKTADLDFAIESYNNAVVDAIHDVADQVGSLRSIERQQAEQASARSSAEAAYDASAQRFKAGLGTYLTVLNAETNVLTQRRLATDLAARSLDAQVLLIRALGGGYMPGTEPPDLRADASVPWWR